MSIDESDLQGLAGASVIGSDGVKIGDVAQFYLSDTTGEPTWATVRTGLFGNKETFVPLSGSSAQPGELRVAFDNATVKDAPRVDADGHLSLDEEHDLYRYYGITDDDDSGIRGSEQPDERALDDSATAGHDDRDDSDNDNGGGDVHRDHDVDPSRRDERDTDAETVTPGETRTRMRRYVVTEHVTQTVEELPDGDEPA